MIHYFEFANGTKLQIEGSIKSSEMILEGELKAAFAALKLFDAKLKEDIVKIN